MEKINRIRKTLIFFIIIFIITTIATLLMTSFFNEINTKIYSSAYTTREITKYPCLFKGNICSEDDISRAIKAKIQVSDSNSYDFYLISNDAETATFIMASNLEDNVDWHSERVNIKGPVNSFEKLVELTKDWNKIPIIEDYNYIDEGQVIYNEICDGDKLRNKESYYDCTSNIIPTRGYKGISIKNGKTTIYYNLPEEENEEYIIMQEYKYENDTRARFIELEELDKFMNNDFTYPDWLIDHTRENGGYWTMSSSTYPTIEYMQGAFAVVNNKNIANKVELYTTIKDNYKFNKIGIRPVITIPKV